MNYWSDQVWGQELVLFCIWEILYEVPQGANFQGHLRGGLIEMRDLFERGGLFDLEKAMVSVLHKEQEYKVKKLENKKVRGHARFNLVRLKF